ncbi:MAG: dimethylarginine dimethylaminohydrolase family protein [Candidatus Promineifilaceae bacterium]
MSEDENEEVEEVEEVEIPEPVVEAKFTYAIVRMPSPTLADGLSSGLFDRPEYSLFLQQHLSYTAVLRSLGVKIIKLPSLPEFPDAQFVEDVAVVTPEVAIITRPGAEERRGETETIRETLEKFRPLAAIEEPGTLDGGDVLRINQTVFVGLSKRTNEEGAAQLAAILEPLGYTVITVPIEESLHLKSDVNYIGRRTLLLTEKWAGHKLFKDFEQIIVPADEAYAANTLLVRNRLLIPEGFPETVNLLREAGFEVLEIVFTEPQKVDGGMTCLSIRF